jgi:hypothetical protein
MLTHNATPELACCQAKIIIQLQSWEETVPEHIALHRQHSDFRGTPRGRMTE